MGAEENFSRDHYVIQDFPFYGSSKVNIARFHDLRSMPVAMTRWGSFLNRCRSLCAIFGPRLLARCATLKAPTNNLKPMINLSRIYGCLSSMVSISPIISIMVWRWGGAFRRFRSYRSRGDAAFAMGTILSRVAPRRILTRYCPKLAVLPTADGYTASSNPRLMLTDLGAYGRTQAARVSRKVYRNFAGNPDCTKPLRGTWPMRAGPSFSKRVRGSDGSSLAQPASTGP